jgi:hypothetical protein
LLRPDLHEPCSTIKNSAALQVDQIRQKSSAKSHFRVPRLIGTPNPPILKVQAFRSFALTRVMKSATHTHRRFCARGHWPPGAFHFQEVIMDILTLALGAAAAAGGYFFWLVAKKGWAYAVTTFSGWWNTGINDVKAAVAAVEARVIALEAAVKPASVPAPTPPPAAPPAV